MTCPRCGRRMQEIDERNVQIDFCAGCRGTWLDKDEVAAFASDDVRAALVEESLFESTLVGAKRSGLACPVCAGPMTEGGLFEADYRIDRCDRCGGVWFDSRELSRLERLQAPRKPPKGTVASPPRREPRRKPRRVHADPVLDVIARELAREGRAMRPTKEPFCPACRRGPSIKDLWQCTCGWVWNVFRTGAKCPSCAHQWKETRCPRCTTWSPHALWYAA